MYDTDNIFIVANICGPHLRQYWNDQTTNQLTPTAALPVDTRARKFYKWMKSEQYCDEKLSSYLVLYVQ